MAHDHAHHHSVPQHVGRAFLIGIILNTAFVIVEFGAGFYTNSLALLSDAGHNLSDVAVLALSFFALQMMKRKATQKYTYGFHKGTVIASLVNAVILLIAVGSIGWEAIERFAKPEETKGNVISIVAAIGIVVNSISAFLFLKNKEKDLNIKGAYLHLLLDAVVSFGVVIAGIIISYTGMQWIDPLISLIIMGVLTYSTWGLLSESFRLALDAVPASVVMEKVGPEVLSVKGVIDIHHVHIWAMSTTKNAMTAHLTVQENLSEKEVAEIKRRVKHKLEHLNIQHVTLETESVDCKNKDC